MSQSEVTTEDAMRSFRTLSLVAMREIYARTLDLQNEMRKELLWWRKHVFRGRLLVLAMLANVAFVLPLSQGSLSQSVDFFLYLNCVAIVVSCYVVWKHFAEAELPWWGFRRTLREVTRGVAEMRAALDEIERVENAS